MSDATVQPTFPWLAPALPNDGIYLNTASAGLPSAPVLDIVLSPLLLEPVPGAAEAALVQSTRIEAASAAAGRLIRAAPHVFNDAAEIDQSIAVAAPLLPGI